MWLEVLGMMVFFLRWAMLGMFLFVAGRETLRWFRSLRD